MESHPIDAAQPASATAPNNISPVTVIPEHAQRRLVYNELIDMLYRQLPLSITGTMVVAVIMIAALWQHRPAVLASNMACFDVGKPGDARLFVPALRLGQTSKPIHPLAHPHVDHGSGHFRCSVGIDADFFYTPESVIHQAMLVILVLGSTTAAMPLIASHAASLNGFLVPALTPFIGRHLLQGETAHVALGLILLAVTLALLSFGRNYNRLIIGSLRNRYENEALARQFAQQNTDLEQARVTAELANRSKTQFFAAASHDLRQPLHAMGLFASALAQKEHVPEVSKLVAGVSGSVLALEALFNELLDISKLDSGVIKPNVTSFRLDDVFERLRSGFVAEAEAKQLRLSIAGAPYTVSSDAILLERILRNLISNAIRYTAAGEIAVVATPADAALRIEVRDTGIGIKAQDRQRIFEEFFQIGNPGRTSRKGLGLGLSIVQRLCVLLGYSIRLTSEYGTGTTFSFEVPMRDTVPHTDDAAPAPEPAPAHLTDKLVVVVDDEITVIEGMKALLTSWGATVIGSTSGNDVVAAVHEAARMPDLLIVDFRIDGSETGIQVAQRIRQELDPEIPAILVTGSTTPELAGQAHAAGLDFLLKPVNAAALRERIGALLKSA